MKNAQCKKCLNKFLEKDIYTIQQFQYRKEPTYKWSIDFFKKLGIDVRFFEPDHPEQIGVLADENTRLVYLESVGNPIISVDTKKKELIGLFANSGQAWTRESVSTYDHDFRSNASRVPSLPPGVTTT